MASLRLESVSHAPLQQEARAASALNHPNIITVYEIGETEGALFIAEERVAGETIRQKLQNWPIPREETLAIALQIATALTAAHAVGVVHRDIKPENVMIRPDGLVKVLDFGLARFVEKTPEGGLDTASLPGFVLGTVRYMSPEQARGQETDGRSDQFSLGVMLYEMIAGVPPFTGATPADTLAAILTADPAPLPPRSFERIVMRCLAKYPADRYTDEELLNELRRAGGSKTEKLGACGRGLRGSRRGRNRTASEAARPTACAVRHHARDPGPHPGSRLGRGDFAGRKAARLRRRGAAWTERLDSQDRKRRGKSRGDVGARTTLRRRVFARRFLPLLSPQGRRRHWRFVSGARARWNAGASRGRCEWNRRDFV